MRVNGTATSDPHGALLGSEGSGGDGVGERVGREVGWSGKRRILLVVEEALSKPTIPSVLQRPNKLARSPSSHSTHPHLPPPSPVPLMSTHMQDGASCHPSLDVVHLSARLVDVEGADDNHVGRRHKVPHGDGDLLHDHLAYCVHVVLELRGDGDDGRTVSDRALQAGEQGEKRVEGKAEGVTEGVREQEGRWGTTQGWRWDAWHAACCGGLLTS